MRRAQGIDVNNNKLVNIFLLASGLVRGQTLGGKSTLLARIRMLYRFRKLQASRYLEHIIHTKY